MRVDGALRPTTWDACLDDLGTRLRDHRRPPRSGRRRHLLRQRRRHGRGRLPDGAGAARAPSARPAKFSPLTIDGTAKVLVSDLVGGSVGLNARTRPRRAPTFVMYVGCNPVVSHGHTVAMPDPVTALRALRDHAEVWVVDPRRTETARLATRHLAPRPGTDHAVLAFLVRELLRDGADRDVLARRTVGRRRAGRRGRAVHPRAHAARVADVAEADLTDLLAAVRRAGRRRRSRPGRASRWRRAPT